MPFVVIKSLDVLPFLRVKQSKKTGRRSVVWHVGPWQYDSASGRHRVRLGRKLRWESATRAQRKAVKQQRAERRAAERAAWDEFFATRNTSSPAPAPTHVVRPSRARPDTGRPDGIGRRAAQPAPLLPGGQPRRAGRVRAGGDVQAAGVCGAVTRDGGRCQRTGDCPYHSGAARPPGARAFNS